MKIINFKVILLSFALFTTFLFGQNKYLDKDDYFIFLDANKHDIKIIENDSLIYTNELKNPKILNKDEYPEGIKTYKYQFIVNKKNYFVNDGGGVVLEFSGNNLKRIDHSFLHRNQYNASEFVYNNEIYLFGGYGLFTHKNILTRYDFKLKEWFLVPYNTKEAPEEGKNYNSILIGDNLYVFGGVGKEEIGIESKLIEPNFLWQLNLKNWTWKKLGQINLNEIIDFSKYSRNNKFIIGDKIYLIRAEHNIVIDITNNKVDYYKSKFRITDNDNIVYNPKNKTFNFIDLKHSERNPELVSIPINQFLGEHEQGEEPFYKKQIYNTLKSILAIVVLISGCVYIVYIIKKGKPIKGNSKQESLLNITYDENLGTFSLNDNIIENLNGLEISILSFLFKNKENYIYIHTLNEIIENVVKTDSLNTILRKREAVLNSIRTKLSILLDVDFNDIILEQKNIQDKRIKEIKLNDKYFKS